MKKALLMTVLSFVFVSPVMAADDGHVHGDDMLETPAAAPVETVESASTQPSKSMSLNHGWGYIGANAAHKWGDLSAQFEMCKKGVEQSPINIDKIVEAPLPPLSASYSSVPLAVENNGHTVQVNYTPGSGFRADDKNFNLMYFKFHTPSEHYVDGAPYPMEVQFFHKAADGSIGVVAVMLKVGAHNPVIEGIWQNVPQAGNVKQVSGVEVNAGDLMPADKSYYKYEGSLTTPPCSEGVKWHVMKEPIELSAAQLKAFQAVFAVNARPIQDLGERTVKGN